MHCPICHTAFDPRLSTTKPFCSERCRTIDLGRWVSEEYSVPVVPDPEDDEQPERFPGDDDEDFAERN